MRALALLLAGCSAYGPMKSSCHQPGESGIQGSPADVHPPAEDAGFSVGAPTACGADGGGRVVVAGTGQALLVSDGPLGPNQHLPDGGLFCSQLPTTAERCTIVSSNAFRNDVLGALRAGGLDSPIPARTPDCGAGLDDTLGVSDWGLVDRAVQVVGSRQASWGLGARLGVVVEPRVCPL